MSEWKLVPVKPTDDMLNAANGCPPNFPEGRAWVDQDNATTYRAMLDAAPQPPSQWPPPRPMSEAPQLFGARVLAYWPRQEQWAESTWLDFCSRWTCDFATKTSPQPTHWLPMPPEPTEQEVSK